MSELTLKKLVKIYPFTAPNRRLFGWKKAREALERELAMPYTTNEGVVAVQDFSLEVSDGEFVVLLGPSGSGKSTILRMIAGLESVSDGEVVLDGEVINDRRPEDRNIAMIFQNYSLYPSFTVYENLAYPLRNLHLPRAEVDRTVRETARLLELTDCLDRRPNELSGGQRQRTAIGRALVRKPKLFLMDEPFSNLDPALRGRLREELKRLHKKLGATVVYVTHDQTDAFLLGDRVAVLRDGILVQSGTPQELYNRPRDLYVASFLGMPPMNLFREVAVLREGKALALPGARVELPPERAEALGDREKVAVGVRPVHLRLAEEGAQATVEQVELVEAECHLTLDIAGTEVTAVIPYSARDQLVRGQKVYLQFAPRRLHLFDCDTGQRL